jgi:hypothetical protein
VSLDIPSNDGRDYEVGIVSQAYVHDDLHREKGDLLASASE